MTVDFDSQVRSAAPPLVLRLVRGTHRGAERACRDRDVILIGSADDCDVVLMGDAGVAAHHCMVRITGGMLYVRAMDAAIRIDGIDVPPGDPQLVQAFQRIDIGQAAFAMGPHWGKEWQTLEQVNAILDAAMAGALADQTAQAETLQSVSPPTPPVVVRRQNRSALLSLAAGLVAAIVALGFAFWPSRSGDGMTAKERLHSVQTDLQTLQKSELKAAMTGKQIEITGVVRDDRELADVSKHLRKYGGQVRINVLTGDHISEQVAELLKVSGVGAQTEYIGAMQVRISGRFGDGVALAKAMNQSAMQDIAPGLKLVPVNQDSPAPTAVVIPNETARHVEALKNAKSFCNASECFLQFSGTGNTYYVGSELPSGAKLTNVTAEAVNILISGAGYQIKLKDFSIGPIPELEKPSVSIQTGEEHVQN
jgi:hypothetical protein